MNTQENTGTKKRAKYVMAGEFLHKYRAWFSTHHFSWKDVAESLRVSTSTLRKARDYAGVEKPGAAYVAPDSTCYESSHWPLIQSFVVREDVHADCLDDLAAKATEKFDGMGIDDLAVSVSAIVEAAKAKRVGWIQKLPRAERPQFPQAA